MTRDRSRVNLPVEVEIVESDMTDPADLRRALDGIDRAFLKKVVHDNGNHFAAVASEVGVRTRGVALLLYGRRAAPQW